MTLMCNIIGMIPNLTIPTKTLVLYKNRLTETINKRIQQI